MRLRRHPRARRLILKFDDRKREAVLTAPTRCPEAEAKAFALRNSGWLEQRLERAAPRMPVTFGAFVPVDGIERLIVPSAGSGVELNQAHLSVSETSKDPSVIISAWLRFRAREKLVPMTERWAGVLGKSVSGFSLRDTTSRWGSCSAQGRIMLSWRLAMAPVEVQQYVTLHEAAHLVEMNHSGKFWALVEAQMPNWNTQRKWLRSEGRKLFTYELGASS